MLHLGAVAAQALEPEAEFCCELSHMETTVVSGQSVKNKTKNTSLYNTSEPLSGVFWVSVEDLKAA